MGLSHPRDAELQLSAGPFWCYPAIIQLIPAWLTCLFPWLAGGSAGSVTARAGPSELYQSWWLLWELLFQPRYQQHILQSKALPHKCPTARSSGPRVGSALVSCPGVQGPCPRELPSPTCCLHLTVQVTPSSCASTAELINTSTTQLMDQGLGKPPCSNPRAGSCKALKSLHEKPLGWPPTHFLATEVQPLPNPEAVTLAHYVQA